MRVLPGRWAWLDGEDIGEEADPYLDRLRIVATPLFGLYVHHIHRADREPDPHDHPWWFASLVLSGAYTEYVWPDKHNPGRWITRERGRWSLRQITRNGAHIIQRTNGSLWTLVLTGPRRSRWGFWKDGTFVPWRDYMAGRNR